MKIDLKEKFNQYKEKQADYKNPPHKNREYEETTKSHKVSTFKNVSSRDFKKLLWKT